MRGEPRGREKEGRRHEADETADSGSHIYVGGVELTGSADAPAYAMTDESGKVTPGGSEDNYHVKWDGTTLTLNGANVHGGYSYIDIYGDPNSTAIYRDGAFEIAIVGENTVTGPDSTATSTTASLPWAISRSPAAEVLRPRAATMASPPKAVT